MNASQREILSRLLDPDGPAALPEAQREAVAALVAERLSLLRRLEWPDDNRYGPSCRICGATPTAGHRDNCELARAIRQATGEDPQ